MNYYNYIVEIKKDYTNQLLFILNPLLFEGIKSIYNDSMMISKNKEELKNF
jgi:hypothetical protein